MSKKSFSDKPWYPYAAAGIIIVIVFVLLLEFEGTGNGIRRFFGYFTPVFGAVILAYVMNRLSMFYERRIFGRLKSEKCVRALGIILTIITVLVCLVLLGWMIIPQLISSISTFTSNLDGYMASAEAFLKSTSLFKNVDLSEFFDSSESVLDFIGNYITSHTNSILSTASSVIKIVISVVISFILAIYMLVEKKKLKVGFERLIKAAFKKKKGGYESAVYFFKKCDAILTRYIIYNFLDCVIVGVANFLFMTLFSLPYAGLTSFIVAVANLVPTFGPMVGGAAGAILLFLVDPWYALGFIIFTFALQLFDGYFIKPRLFGTTLGVSLTWILIAIIVCGRAFGVVGILASIPGIAVLDLVYKEYFIPWLEKRPNPDQ